MDKAAPENKNIYQIIIYLYYPYKLCYFCFGACYRLNNGGISEKENVPEREDNNQKNEDDPNGSGFGQ